MKNLPVKLQKKNRETVKFTVQEKRMTKLLRKKAKEKGRKGKNYGAEEESGRDAP